MNLELFRPKNRGIALEESLVAVLVPRSALHLQKHFANDQYLTHIKTGIESFSEAVKKIYGKCKPDTNMEYGRRDHILETKSIRLVYNTLDLVSLYYSDSHFESKDLVANFKIEESMIQLRKLAQLFREIESTHALEMRYNSKEPSLFYHPKSKDLVRSKGIQLLGLLDYLPKEVAIKSSSGEYSLATFTR